jgi:hypothetical protein
MSESWKNYTVIDEADSGKSWGTDYTVIDDEGLESAEAEDKPWYSAVTDAIASGVGGFNEAIFSGLNVPYEAGREVHQMIWGGDVNRSLPNFDEGNPTGGANAVKNLLDYAISFGPRVGGDVDESGIPYQVGKEGALNLASLAPAGAAANATKYTYSLFKPIVELVRSNPVAAVLMDAGLSLPQGIGAWFGRKWGEGFGEGGTGEELGRIGGASVIAAPWLLYKGGSLLANKAMKGFGQGEAAQEHVAGDMMKGVMTKAEQDLLEAGDLDLPPGGPFTTGEAVDSGGLTRLRDAIINESDPSLKNEMIRLEAREDSLVETLNSLVSDTPNRVEAATFIKNLITNSLKRINSLKDSAISRAQARIDKLDPETSLEASQRAARDELSKAFKLALKQQSVLWNNIGDGRFLTRAIIQRAKEIVANTPRLTGEKGVADIPDRILNIAGRDAVIGPNGKVIKKAEKSILNEVESADEIAALSGAFNDEIAAANIAGHYRKADMLGKMRDSIYDDIIPVVGDTVGLEQARAFSRVLHDKFTRGPVGSILGTKARGEVKVDPEQTLEKLIKPGIAGKLGVQALRRAETATTVGKDDLPHSEFPRQEPAIDLPVKQYLINNFLLHAMSDGKINPVKAQTFVNKYPVLDLYPDLKAQMLDATAAQKWITTVTAAALRRTQSIKNQTVASKVLGGEVGVRIDSIITGKTGNPIRDTDELLRLASKDETGQTLKGIQDALFDHMFNYVTRDSKGLKESSRTTLHPKTMDKFVKNKTNRAVLERVYGKDGMKLIDSVVKGLLYQSRGKPLGAVKGRKGEGADVGREFAGNLGTVMGVRLLGRITKQPLLSAGVGKRWVLMAFDWLRDSPQANVMAMLQRALEEPDFARSLLTPVRLMKGEEAMGLYRYMVGKGGINIGANIDAPEAADAVLTAADSVRSRVSAY